MRHKKTRSSAGNSIPFVVAQIVVKRSLTNPSTMQSQCLIRP